MKKMIILSCCLFCMIFFAGCGEKTLDYSIIARDDERTGGSLTFSYDAADKVAYFGGAGEMIEYYQPNITKGWTEGGCKVGIKLAAPSSVKEFESGIITINGNKTSAGNFYRTVNDEKVGIVVLYLNVDEKHREFNIKIQWEDRSKEQQYKVVIKKETTFQDESSLTIT